jgi:signal transduction histidine kinase
MTGGGAGRAWRRAAVLASSFAVVTILYMAASSEIAARSATSLVELRDIEQLKGVGSILASSVALFVISGGLFRRADLAAEEVARQRDVLVAAERQALAGTLAGAIAHDANNALTVLLAEVDRMVAHDEPDRRSLAAVRQSAERILELNSRLVSATRQSAATDARPVDLTDAVRGTVQVLLAHPALRHCRVEVEGDAVQLHASPGVVAQIVSNLVLNAGEATDGRGQVRVRVRRDGDQARIEVDDDGPGRAGAPRGPVLRARDHQAERVGARPVLGPGVRGGARRVGRGRRVRARRRAVRGHPADPPASLSQATVRSVASAIGTRIR